MFSRMLLPDFVLLRFVRKRAQKNISGNSPAKSSKFTQQNPQHISAEWPGQD